MRTTDANLEPIEPRTALKLYLDDREAELADQTHRTHRTRLGRLCEWCEEERIDNLNDLTGRDIRRYKIELGSNVKETTLKTYLDTLRVFLRLCRDVDAVHPELPNKVPSPDVKRKCRSRHIDAETAEQILDYLRKYEYASARHMCVELLWHTSIRRGALVSLDLDDWYPHERYLELTHRPETDTPLKNGREGERPVAISEGVATSINDWIADQRPNAIDDHGREPLIAWEYGRIHGQTIQKYVYQVTRPCYYGIECPEGRDPDTCEATEHRRYSLCPVNIAPHDLRRSSITYYLQEGATVDNVSDRSDVSREILDEHYDQMTKQEKMNQRREFFDHL